MSFDHFVPDGVYFTRRVFRRGKSARGALFSPARRDLPAIGILRRSYLDLSSLRQNRATSMSTSDFRQQTPDLRG